MGQPLMVRVWVRVAKASKDVNLHILPLEDEGFESKPLKSHTTFRVTNPRPSRSLCFSRVEAFAFK